MFQSNNRKKRIFENHYFAVMAEDMPVSPNVQRCQYSIINAQMQSAGSNFLAVGGIKWVTHLIQPWYDLSKISVFIQNLTH